MTIDPWTIGNKRTSIPGQSFIPVPVLPPKPPSPIISLADAIIDQDLTDIETRLIMYQAGLCPDNQPAGAWLLAGPTGTGKTYAVQKLAEKIHGSNRQMLRFDCAEYALEHEVARLIGAPPGYVGHKETSPGLTQSKLAAVTSDKSRLSVVLFDEIEKGHSSLHAILLGILDRGILTTGESQTVNFQHSLIFFTTNLGQTTIAGLDISGIGNKDKAIRYVHNHALANTGKAIKKFFAPEFLNRLTGTVLFKPLAEASLYKILDIELEALQNRLDDKLREHSPGLAVTDEALTWLIKNGTSIRYGARELKRLIEKQIVEKLAKRIALGERTQGRWLRIDMNEAGTGLAISVVESIDRKVKAQA